MKASDVHYVEEAGTAVSVFCGRTGKPSLRARGKAERGRLIASTRPSPPTEISGEHQGAWNKKYKKCGAKLPTQPPDVFPMQGVQIWTARDHDRPLVFRDRMPQRKLASSFGAAGESFVLAVGTTPRHLCFERASVQESIAATSMYGRDFPDRSPNYRPSSGKYQEMGQHLCSGPQQRSKGGPEWKIYPGRKGVDTALFLEPWKKLILSTSSSTQFPFVHAANAITAHACKQQQVRVRHALKALAVRA